MFSLALALVLLRFAEGCGRVGVALLLPQAPSDAATYSSPMDAATFDSGTTLPPPVLVSDASTVFDAAMDAGRAVDAGNGALDATAASDASRIDAASDAAPPRDAAVMADTSTPRPCQGQRLFGLCWYLGASSANCADTCSTHGGFDSDAIQHIGSANQGGSLADCTQILGALGQPGSVGEGMRDDSNGFGCHLWSDGARWWLAQPDFSPDLSARISNVRIVCGCLR